MTTNTWQQKYDQWAKDNGVKFTLGPRHFNERLRSKGCEAKSKRYSNSFGTEKVGKCWQGVTLKDKPQRDKEEDEQEIDEKIEEEIPF